MSITQTTWPAPVQQKFAGKLLSTPQARLIHSLMATPIKIPANSGDIIRQRRYSRFETVPVPVDPAMNNPPAQVNTQTDIDIKARWYSTYTVITKQVSFVNQDPILNGETARLGQCMRETEDQLIRDLLEATAGIVNCTGGVNGDNPTEVTRGDLDGVVATLQDNDAEFIYEMIEGENKFGTGPISDSYAGLCHTRMIPQLENVAGFINKAQYPNPNESRLASEWGSIGNVRFFLSSRGSITTAGSLLGADIYNMFIVAQEAYCAVELDGATTNIIYHPPGWGDDPTELRQTLGFRMTFGSGITNNLWLTMLRATLA